MDPTGWFGDKGYVGRGMITPIKKPAHRDLNRPTFSAALILAAALG